MSFELDTLTWNQDGLIPCIVQDEQTHEVLMMAWMNATSLEATLNEKLATYWSRSRKSLWRKGETSGHFQKVKAIYLDCDKDTLLIKVEQVGGIACHTGRRSCFFYEAKENEWQITANNAPLSNQVG